jgi:hypothetical protein
MKWNLASVKEIVVLTDLDVIRVNKMKKEKPDCYRCKYRGSLPGSAHSCCKHPSLKEAMENPMLQLMGIFASVGRVAPMMANSKELNIKANPTGIKNGWFNFPFNFDPIWLERCDGFSPKVGGGGSPPKPCEEPVACDECPERYGCYTENKKEA